MGNIKTVLALGLSLITITSCANGQTNDAAVTKLATQQDAVKAVSQLRAGMREEETRKILAAHGLASIGLSGSGHHYTIDYPLAEGANLRISFQYKEPVLPRTNTTAWANDLLIDAGIWSNGNKTAWANYMLIQAGIQSNGIPHDN